MRMLGKMRKGVSNIHQTDKHNSCGICYNMQQEAEVTRSSEKIEWHHEVNYQIEESEQWHSLDAYNFTYCTDVSDNEWGYFQEERELSELNYNILHNINDLEPEYSKIVDEHYWDLI